MTYFRDFKRGDGTEVTVEYRFSAGSPTTYSPATGADGGDADEVEIVKAFDDAGPVELTDAEREAFEEEVCLDPPDDEPLDCW
jgi:hypothetical protein